MKLDPRIKSLSDVLTIFDIDKANQFIGQKGYFAIALHWFGNIGACPCGTLGDVFDTEERTFQRAGDRDYPYFIPESSLKPIEKKYRPYTLEEFCDKFQIGQPIKFRAKETDGVRLRLALLGYREYREGANIYIGPYYYNLEELFEDYEWHDDATGSWVPFGVEE